MKDFGIFSVQQLRATGWTRERLKQATTDGTLWHVRRGYYCRPTAHPALVRAVRLGGVATCLTALRVHGVWVPSTDLVLHVLVARNASRLRDPDHKLQPRGPRADVRVHWQSTEAVKPTLLRFKPVVPPVDAVVGAAECLSDELLVAVIDSALFKRVIRSRDLPALAAALPVGRRHVIAMVDGRAQSGGESVVRYRLQMLGYRVTIQVGIRHVGSVDILVEDLLIIEVDGREFHLGEAFVEDRRRDLELTIQRRPHLRLTYAQVFDTWEHSLRAIEAALASSAA